MHLVALDELLGLGLRARGIATGVGEDELDLAAGERVVALLQEKLDALLHLLAAGGERAGAHREEADAERLGLRVTGKRHQQRAGKRERSKHCLLLGVARD